MSSDRDYSIHLVIIGVGISLGIPTIVILLTFRTNLEFAEVTNLTSAVGSILLSAILAYLYLKMWSTQEERTSVQQNQEDILDKQAEIQQSQHEILQTEKKALLDILKRETIDDDCQFNISNYGGGAIVELYIVTQLKQVSGSALGQTVSTQLTRTGSEDGGKIIGPDEKNVDVFCCPQFEVQSDEDTMRGSFSEITTHLSNKGIDEIYIQISLTTADEFGNPTEKNLFQEETEIHRNMKLAEIDAWKNN
ncbi:hypothetical protein [Halorubrum ezzemoulense]|uniref:hypothetical protein n=1 Tax=Halorubrum ezzemoulense TaxID=337243 RepID=UPI00111C2334|nr:hypothetical protein [Halorubrum ezzemoulense]